MSDRPVFAAPVIGVAVGAGGQTALTAFLHNLPADSGLTLLIALSHIRNLAQLLSQLRRASLLPLSVATDGASILPNQIYLAPVKTSVRVADGKLHLAAMPTTSSPLDDLLVGLAADQGSNAVGVLLAGKGQDGIVGLRAIKEQGGWTLAQSSEDARPAALPRRAITAGVVETVGDATELAEQLVGRLGLLADNVAPDTARVEEADLFSAILALVHTQTGHELGSYKRSTLYRRINRRVQVNALHDLRDYLDFLRIHPDEITALYRDSLVSVTSFFRDPDAFDTLERDCIPQLFDGRSRNDSIRVWVVGCASGEEAYSVAILLAEQAARHHETPRLQIFATDVDEEAIAFARRGLYPRAIAQDLVPNRLARYFQEEERGYRVKVEIRELVLFAAHNVLKDPVFSKLDLICCRNLLIYFNRDAQEKLFGRFHYALNPQGYLFLGTAESAEAVSQLFEVRDKRCHLYQRRDANNPTSSRLLPAPAASRRARLAAHLTRLPESRPRSLEELYQAWVLRRYAPPRLLVNENYDVTHLFGGAGRYLRERDGELTQNILQKVLPELRFELRAGLYQALIHHQRTVTRQLEVEIQAAARLVRLDIGPVAEPGFPQNYAEVVFFEEPKPVTGATPEKFGDGSYEQTLIDRLEEELLRSRERMESLIEEHEIANQELTASNEELQSINEELSSTTEELEISKEELQSMNEELMTVNNELKLKLDELSRANSDLSNLISATDVGTLFLDRGLRLKRFTPRAGELFHLLTTDLGRPFAHLAHRLRHGRLVELASLVLETLHQVEELMQSEENHWYIMRVLPYRTVEQQVDGVVITFVDVTDLKRAETEFQQRIQQQAVADLGRQALENADMRTLIGVATVRATEVLDAKICQLFERQPDGEGLLLVAAAGLPPEAIRLVTVPATARYLAGFALLNGEPVFVSDQTQERRFALAPHIVEQGMVSGIAVVVPGFDGPFGVLTVHSDQPGHFTAYDADFLQAIANLLGTAIARQHDQNALREREQRFRTLADAVPQIIWTADRHGQTTYLNQRWFNYTGLSLAESMTDTTHVIHPADRPAATSLWADAQQRRQAYEQELRLRSADGHYRWFLMRTAPVVDQDGDVVEWFGSSTDIDDRVRADLDRQLLSELDAQFRMANDVESLIAGAETGLGRYLSVPLCALAEVDQSADRIRLSPAWHMDVPGVPGDLPLTSFFGAALHSEAQAGKTIVIDHMATDPRIQAAGRDDFSQWRPSSIVLVPCLRAEELVALWMVVKAQPHRWSDTEVALIEAVAARLWAAVEKARVQAALRASEHELRVITNAVPGLIAYVDADERYRFVNATYERWFNRPVADIVGHKVSELLGAGYATPEKYIAAALSGQPVTFEYGMTYADRRRTVFANYMPDQAPDGQVRGFYALITDVTERKQAEHNNEFLAALTAQISLLTDPQEILRVTAAALGPYLNAVRCHFSEIDLDQAAGSVLSEWHRAGVSALEAGETFSRLTYAAFRATFESGQSVAVEDITLDERIRADLAEFTAAAIRSWIVSPYLREGKWVAVLAVHSDAPRRWRAEEMALVETVIARVWPLIEQARSIQALHWSEERYRTLFANAGEAIFVANPEGVYIEVNPSACELLGYSQAELLGKPIEAVIPPADQTRLAEVRQLLAGGQAHVAEWTLLRKDGPPVPVEVSAKILPDGRWQAFVRDITERNQARQRLQFLAEASVALAGSLNYEVTLATVARLAVPSLADWCVIDLLEEDGNIQAAALVHSDPAKVAWAHALRNRYPIEPDAPAGAPNVIRSGQSEYYPEISDELLEHVAADEEQLALLRSVGYRSIIVTPLEARGRVLGALTLVSTTISRLFSPTDLAMAEELARRAAVAIDNAQLFRTLAVSEQNLRNSEARSQRQLAELQAVYASAPVGLAVLDTDLRYVRINDTLAQMNGFPVAAHIGATAKELMPGLANHLDQIARRVIETGEPVVNLEVTSSIVADSAEPRVWLESLYPLRSPHGQIEGINAVVQDISERKRQEAELKLLNEQLERRVQERTAELERSNRDLDQFAYVASHDLKAPLRGIAQLARWISEDAGDALPPPAQDHLDKLHSRVRRMNALLDDLLAYSRAGRVKHTPQQVAIADLLHNIVETLAPPANFRIVYADSLPVVYTERVPLEMVLRNLIGNAIKHHSRPDGTVVITVRAHETYLEFSVKDDGPGIAPEFHSRIFEMFQTLRPRDQVEGSGIGLAIVKKLVEAAGGTVTVESAKGEGTNFIFTWPRLEADDNH